MNFVNKTRQYVTSFIYPLLFALPLSFFVDGIEKYIFKDWEFLKFLVVLIALDTLLSWIYHIFFTQDFSSKGFGMIFVKLITYGALMIVGHVMGSFSINNLPQETFTWFRSLILTALLVREALSIVENTGKIYPQGVPLWIRKYLKDFDEHGFAIRPNNNKEENERVNER